ncbi:SDR family NAD(P)-dependent oxidoreductase [Sphingomonas daechungensis]|uniref:SDR family NAD(P)-dependent oxidoreductase n=1 Tax=Sphingomonas daechungensis TaxID=1176646 RepID=UPI003782F39E
MVTGAGRGIGLAAATALHEAGAQVTLVARSSQEIEHAAAQLGALAQAHALDVSDLEAVHRFFIERPAFDILLNNAGTNRPKPMWEATEFDFDVVLDLNVKSAYFVAQACARRMIAEGIMGSLIHMSSQMGHVAGPNRSLYCASKWAVEGMSKAFALDLAPHGIRSNTIAPTFIETPLTKPMFEDQKFKADVLAKIKLGRIGTTDDVVGAIVFLASDSSSLITGTSIVVDGGWTAD